jgi:MraZ protein
VGKNGNLWLKVGKNILILLSETTKNMTSFIGDYVCKVDEKGRMLFPSAFKKQNKSASPDRYVVKKDIFESCLVLFNMEEWERQNNLFGETQIPTTASTTSFLEIFIEEPPN